MATKGGSCRQGESFRIDARRESIRRHCEISLRLLGVDSIALYQLHWPDPDVSMREAMKVFAELRDEGLVQNIGVSNVSVEQLEEAMSMVCISSVQNKFSVLDQSDRRMMDYCGQKGIAYLAYSPLRQLAAVGRRREGPRLSDQFPGAAGVAMRKGVSIYRLALRWLLTTSPVIIPVVGASRPESIRDCASAGDLDLTAQEIAELDFYRC